MSTVPTPPSVPQGYYRVSGIDLLPSSGFAAWLDDQRAALVVSVGDQLLTVGRDDGELRVDEHPYGVAAGVYSPAPGTIVLAADWQLWRLEDALRDGQTDAAGHDRVFLPQSAHTTGFLGAYDLAAGLGGTTLFTSTVANCVAMVSPRRNFTAVWKPPFVSSLGGGDRCHLTGLCTIDGELAFVTSAATTDVVDGWRDSIGDGGVLIDARSQEIVAAGLCLPHSPRMWGDRVLVASAGTGELLAVDPADGSTETVARIDGLARGLRVSGRFAILGSSTVPAGSPYANAPIATTGRRRHGIVVVDLQRGAVAEELELRGSSGETVALDLLEATTSPSIVSSTGGRTEVLSIA